MRDNQLHLWSRSHNIQSRVAASSNPTTSWSAREAVEINITEPFQPADFNFPKIIVANRITHFNPVQWFSEFPWLYYNEQSDSVLCFICMQQNAKSNLPAARSKEVCFISEGFSNWKKALARFKEHQVSECHKIAIDYETNLSRTCGNVCEMSRCSIKLVWRVVEFRTAAVFSHR